MRRVSRGQRIWRRTSSGALTASTGHGSSRCEMSLPWARDDWIGLRRPMADSPREGALDLVQMLTAVDGARQRPRA